MGSYEGAKIMRQDVEQIINNTKIDETKLPEAMRIIDRAASIMEECYYDTDPKAKEKLIALQNELRELTGKENYDIEEVNEYWSYTSLETKAIEALMQEPFRVGLPEEALRELITEIFRSGDLEKEALFYFWTNFLKIETGIDKVMGYLFTKNDKGEIVYAPVDEVMERIRRGKALAEKNVIFL